MPVLPTLFTLLVAIFTATPLQAANECAGVEYRQTGQSCRSIGLNSNQAICRPGDRVAQLCDDKKGGWIRTCNSGIACANQPAPVDRPEKGTWQGEFVYFKGDWRHCSTLRFNKKRQPLRFCDSGRSNPDCRGKCQRSKYGGNDYGTPQYNNPDYGYGHNQDGQFDGDFVYYRGQWRKCSNLRYDSRRRPIGFCADGRRNKNCRGTCESWSF